jgi:acyl carrier protein
MSLSEADRKIIDEIVIDSLELDPEEVTATSLFKEDHDADSLGAIEILAALEKTFKIDIPQDGLNRMVNLEGVYSVVEDAKLARVSR